MEEGGTRRGSGWGKELYVVVCGAGLSKGGPARPLRTLMIPFNVA